MRVMVIHNDRPLATLSMLQVRPQREKVRASKDRVIKRERKVPYGRETIEGEKERGRLDKIKAEQREGAFERADKGKAVK